MTGADSSNRCLIFARLVGNHVLAYAGTTAASEDLISFSNQTFYDGRRLHSRCPNPLELTLGSSLRGTRRIPEAGARDTQLSTKSSSAFSSIVETTQANNCVVAFSEAQEMPLS